MVPSLVLAEVAYLLGERRVHDELEFARAVAGGELLVESVEASDWPRIVELVERYEDLRQGIVDASVVAVCERFGETKLATLDRRHFSVIRPRHCESFELLPS